MKEAEYHITLENKGLDKPQHVWVWGYFFSPLSETNGRWSNSPIKIENPFDSSNERTVIAKAHFHWHDNPYTPKSDYYAKINISTVSEEDVIIAPNLRNKTIQAATPVEIVK